MFTTRRQIFETCGNRASRGTRKRWDRRWLTNRARANHRSRLLDALLPQDGITTLKVGDVVQSFVLSIPRRRKVIDRGSAGIDFSERSVRPRNALRHPEAFYFTPCSALNGHLPSRVSEVRATPAPPKERSEERRVGKECVRTCR